MDGSEPRLTGLAHGGGCGCKLSPAVLRGLLAEMPPAGPFAGLLVGTETADDAAVWQVDARTCVVATTDFFTPIVDDPRDFGRIAATNAISDVHAMGGKPVMALAILGVPVDRLPAAAVRAILAGGAEACAGAGIPVAGGHSIDTPEPIHGLAVVGLGEPARVRRNSMARAGDALVPTKPLGVGIYSAVPRKGALGAEAYAEMIRSTTLLNRIGADLARHEHVHAMTDVTGFGLLGHALEMARGSGVGIELEADKVPLLDRAPAWAQAGHVTGASKRNWASYGAEVRLPDAMPDWLRHLLTDPQTSGGLLVSCAAKKAGEIVAEAREVGYPAAAIVGRAVAGPSIVTVTSRSSRAGIVGEARPERPPS